MDNGRAILVAVILLFIRSKVYCNVWTSEIILQQGKLRGILDWRNGYKSYLGIPYASVTKRFQDATPAPSWNGILYATQGSIKCNQYFSWLNRPIGQEDCLVVNIFAPMKSDSVLYPVMIFIPGGGYYDGSNTNLIYNPKYLVRKDVIVVTINYRIGAFGFLCLHVPEAPGNIGLKDQIVALQWIKDNIIAFGGNSNAITVFGESAGASSIHYMITTGKYKELFTRAILQSGSVLSPIKIDNNPIRTASSIASRMGFKSEDPNVLLKIFQNASADDIVKASYMNPKNQPLKLFVFNPCVESPAISKEPYITETPRKLVESKEIDPNLNIIYGYTDKEGIPMAAQYDINGFQTLNSNLSVLIPVNIEVNSELQIKAITHDIREMYFRDGINYDSLIEFYSDEITVYPSIVSINSLLSSNATVYNYYFKYNSFRNLYKFINGLPQIRGASHADDLFYLFDPIIYNFVPTKISDLRFIDSFTSLWTTFAKTGIPSSKDIEWIQSKPNNLKFLQLDEDIKIIPLPNKDRYLFWDQIYKIYKAQ